VAMCTATARNRVCMLVCSALALALLNSSPWPCPLCPCALRKRIAARGRRHKTALVQVSAATVCSGAGRLPAKGPPFTFVSALPRFFRSLFSPLLLSVDAVILCRRRVLSSPKLPLHSFSGHSLLNKHQPKNPTHIFQSTTFFVLRLIAEQKLVQNEGWISCCRCGDRIWCQRKGP